MITNRHEVWLTFNGEKTKMKLPVSPEKITVSSGTKDKTVNIIGLGDILTPENRPLYEISFSSFFPSSVFPGLSNSDYLYPINAVKRILEWKNSLKPIHFIVAGLDIDFYARITSFKYYEEGGDVGTIYFDISLKEYREISIRSVTIQSNTATVNRTNTRTDNTTKDRTYTVKTGDCLWTIAQKFYGDGLKYTKIYNANKDKIRADYIIYAGQVLTIPS